jgi:hypothetical protein
MGPPLLDHKTIHRQFSGTRNLGPPERNLYRFGKAITALYWPRRLAANVLRTSSADSCILTIYSYSAELPPNQYLGNEVPTTRRPNHRLPKAQRRLGLISEYLVQDKPTEPRILHLNVQ